MLKSILLILYLAALCGSPAAWLTAQQEQRQLLLVVGAPGEEQYAAMFEEWSNRWLAAAENADLDATVIPQPGNESSRLQLETQLQEFALVPKNNDDGKRTLWIVFIGHGTFDGQTAKFNLEGRDISAKELAELVSNIPGRQVIINTASASGPFISQLSGPDRVIVPATQSGYEFNFARFGDFLSQAVQLAGDDPQALDLDKDQRISLLEMVLFAASRTREFYESDLRLQSEHSLVDDNGDGLGTPTDWFRGVRADVAAKSGKPTDGLKANQLFLFPAAEFAALAPEQLARRDQLEQQLERLRAQKSQLDETDYYQQLEAIMLQLGDLYLGEQSATETLQPGNEIPRR